MCLTTVPPSAIASSPTPSSRNCSAFASAGPIAGDPIDGGLGGDALGVRPLADEVVAFGVDIGCGLLIGTVTLCLAHAESPDHARDSDASITSYECSIAPAE